MRIPKIIHFIWAGGDDELSLSYIESVNLWIISNDGFEVWLWVDEKSASSSAAWIEFKFLY
jgi:mannosyltransferase OCH1-like enzyme